MYYSIKNSEELVLIFNFSLIKEHENFYNNYAVSW